MVDFLLDDVKELLLKDIGDPIILTRIQRAAERGEVISVYERQYVKKLAYSHLRKKPEQEPTKTIVIPESNPSVFPQKENQKPIITKSQRNQTFVSKIPNEKKTKIAFAIGAIVLAIILVVGISQSNIGELDSGDDASSSILAPSKTTGLILKTDVTSYGKGDIISISGSSNPSLGSTVKLSIQNPSGSVIWSEDVKIKSSGEYSTLTIAGGSGWETGGKYYLKAEHGTITKEVTINFSN